MNIKNEDKLKVLDAALKIIMTAVLSYALREISGMKDGITGLNIKMATILERTINQENDINEVKGRVRRLEDLNFRSKEGK